MHLFGNHTTVNGNWTVNDTVIHQKDCRNNVTHTTTLEEKVDIQAFLYIAVVVVFYAASITFLLINYAKNYHEDKDVKYYYSEFVERDRFKELQYQNKVALERTKMKLESIKCNSSDGSTDLKQSLNNDLPLRNSSSPVVTFNCPIITITTCSEDSQSTYSGSRLRDICIDTDMDTMTNGGSGLRLIKSPDLSYEGSGMNYLTVPLYDDNRLGDLAFSYDSGVDYMGGHGPDDWADENGFQESKPMLPQANVLIKSKSTIEVEHMSTMQSGGNQQNYMVNSKR